MISNISIANTCNSKANIRYINPATIVLGKYYRVCTSNNEQSTNWVNLRNTYLNRLNTLIGFFVGFSEPTIETSLLGKYIPLVSEPIYPMSVGRGINLPF